MVEIRFHMVICLGWGSYVYALRLVNKINNFGTHISRMRWTEMNCVLSQHSPAELCFKLRNQTISLACPGETIYCKTASPIGQVLSSLTFR